AMIDQGDLEWRKTNLNRSVGNNLRYTDIQAALALAQLEELSERLSRKRAVFTMLSEILGDCLYHVPGSEAPLHNIVFSERPDALPPHPPPHASAPPRQYRTISQHPAFSHLATQPFPESDFWASHAVFLPFGMGLTREDAHYMGEVVRDSGLVLSTR